MNFTALAVDGPDIIDTIGTYDTYDAAATALIDAIRAVYAADDDLDNDPNAFELTWNGNKLIASDAAVSVIIGRIDAV